MADKKITKNSPRKTKVNNLSDFSESVVESERESECCSSSPCSRGKVLKKHLLFLVFLVVLAAVFGYFFKDKIIVAVVNGKPVFGYALNQKLTKSYGKETLENIIVEQLIKEEADKKGIVVSDADVKTEIDKVTKSLGAGVTIEDALKYQGITLDDFKQQLRIRLQVNKILEKDINVTGEELDKFIKDNDKLLTASGEAERKTEAEAKLKEQKISAKIQTWVSELIAKAKITRFLK